MDSAHENYLKELYYNPKQTTAFSSASKLWHHIKQHGADISRNQLNDWLSKQDVYTSHHPIIRRFATQRVVTRGLNDVWDADLMDMSNLSKENDDYTFIAVFIDIFSRYLYVHPMKDKTAESTLDAIKSVFSENKVQPETLRSDNGKEFTGGAVKEYLVAREVYQQISHSEKKANYAERVIQTLKKKIYRYLYANYTERYIDALDQLVEGYNNTYHTGIKRAPSSINKDNEVEVWAEQYIPKPSHKVVKVSFKFSIGDTVRVSNARNAFSRGYGQTFSEELFTVRERHSTIPLTYTLQDLKQRKVKGVFYEPEMVLVTGKDENSVFRVEKIIKDRTRKGVKEVLVRWKGYSSDWDTWEPESNIR